MITRIKQFRYYGDSHVDTYPTDLTKIQLCEENILQGLGSGVIQLGIQAPPQTIFYLNSNQSHRNGGIVVGSTGIYELEVKNLTYLTTLQFDAETLPNNLIIDVIYQEQGV